MECGFMHLLLASTMQAELGDIFTNFQKGVHIWTILTEINHSKPAIPLSVYNPDTSGIINDKPKQYIYRNIYIRLYWVHDCMYQGH